MSASGACRVPGRLQRAAGGDATGAQPKRKKESKAMEAPVRQPGGLLYFFDQAAGGRGPGRGLLAAHPGPAATSPCLATNTRPAPSVHSLPAG